ncbi:MAG: hypothetical protein ABR89_05465, partial [Rhodobacter sp. BACL10 MAG-120910-bin24]
ILCATPAAGLSHQKTKVTGITKRGFLVPTVLLTILKEIGTVFANANIRLIWRKNVVKITLEEKLV